jgi:hypothetical protein
VIRHTLHPDAKIAPYGVLKSEMEAAEELIEEYRDLLGIRIAEEKQIIADKITVEFSDTLSEEELEALILRTQVEDPKILGLFQRYDLFRSINLDPGNYAMAAGYDAFWADRTETILVSLNRSAGIVQSDPVKIIGGEL